MKIFVIGDSHASFLGRTNLRSYSIESYEEFSIHYLYCGPQLAWTFNKCRLKETFTNEIVYEVVKADVIVFYFGEIDVRCHLVPHGNPLELARRYWKAIEEFDSPCSLILEPVRQSQVKIPNEAFPQRGQLHERLIMHNEFVLELSRLSSLDRFLFQLAGARNDGLALEDTCDGCHLSDTWNKVTKKYVLERAMQAIRSGNKS